MRMLDSLVYLFERMYSVWRLCRGKPPLVSKKRLLKRYIEKYGDVVLTLDYDTATQYGVEAKEQADRATADDIDRYCFEQLAEDWHAIADLIREADPDAYERKIEEDLHALRMRMVERNAELQRIQHDMALARQKERKAMLLAAKAVWEQHERLYLSSHEQSPATDLLSNPYRVTSEQLLPAANPFGLGDPLTDQEIRKITEAGREIVKIIATGR